VLEGASKLRGDASCSMKLDDWNILARVLPSRSVRDVQSIFYPDAPDDVVVDLEAKGQGYRRPKFMVAFDDRTYYRMYQTILQNPDLQFPDIQTLFRVGRQLGKIMSQVMIHVGQWLNLRPMQISERDNNKPQLWRDFIPAFQEEYGDGSEEMALHLQQQIFGVVHKRIEEFTDSPASAYLSKLPDAQGDSYLERFTLPIWKDLLVTVHQAVGSRFQRSLVKFNTQCPKSLPSQPESSLTHILRDAISRVPEIRVNPALCSSQALEVLMTRISPIVADWAVQLGGATIKTQSQDGISLWPSNTVDIATFEDRRLDAAISRTSLDEGSSPQCSPPSMSSSVVSVAASTERHGDEIMIGGCSETLPMSVMKRCGLEQKDDFEMNRSSILKILNA
jgi:hypothetical protein